MSTRVPFTGMRLREWRLAQRKIITTRRGKRLVRPWSLRDAARWLREWPANLCLMENGKKPISRNVLYRIYMPVACHRCGEPIVHPLDHGPAEL